jgi:hypothetical protein
VQPTIVGAVVALLASAGLMAPTVYADGSVVLGGGAGIVVEGSYCTLATIGDDHTGELVGFTAGHCGGTGAPVVAEGADNHGPVGTVAAVGDGLDYGVIKFDPAKVTQALATCRGLVKVARRVLSIFPASRHSLCCAAEVLVIREAVRTLSLAPRYQQKMDNQSYRAD